MPKYVRVRDTTSELGLELSVPERKAVTFPDRYQVVLDDDGNAAPAADRAGNPLDPVYRAGDDAADDPDALPNKNATTEVWQAYATSHGFTAEDAASKSRSELVAHFTKEN